MQLSIIIVNFNVKYFLEQCLSSVIQASKNISVEIIVVDNNSMDGSREFFAGRFSDVSFIWSGKNEGFAKANNLALKKAVGECVLFLNPDTILAEDTLENCLAFLQSREDIGAAGVCMIDGSGNFLKESKRGFPSPQNSLYKLSGITALFPKSEIFAGYYLGHLEPDKNHEADVLAGAFMMVKKKVLDKTGSFDEQFFLYGEDIDLSYRIQKAGFKNFYFAETTIIHFKGESMQKGSLRHVRLFYSAMAVFVKKHYSSGVAGFYNTMIGVAIGIKSMSSFFRRLWKRPAGNRKQIAAGKRCFIVADEKEFELIRNILQGHNRQQDIIGRIDPGVLVENGAAGNLEQLPGLAAGHQIKEIFFVIKECSSKEVIAMVQQLPPGIKCWFHFAGTFGLVGSWDKASTGDVLI